MKWKWYNLETANIGFTAQVFKNYGSLETQTAGTTQKSYWQHRSQLPRSWLPRYFCHCMPSKRVIFHS